MKQKFIDAYMKTAEIFAELSSAKRLHVGALVVKDDRIISIGYNGMPSGWDNVCEFREYTLGGLAGFLDEDGSSYNLKTKPEVLHAESNAIAKLAKSTESGDGATMFITHAPCLDCAKLIYQSGISSILYRNSYRDTAGLDFLSKAGLTVTQV